MVIEDILSPERTLMGARAASKKKVLEVVAEEISHHVPAINAKDLFNSLISRERLGTTGLGRGIAIPRCRCQTCQKPAALLITLDEPVDFDAIDKEPVDIVLALIVPQESTQEHLNLLQALAERFRSDALLQNMRLAQTDTALYAAFINASTVC